MTKLDKLMGLPKLADEKRLDPEGIMHGKRHKKVYPQHWEARYWGKTWLLLPHKMLRPDIEWGQVPPELCEDLQKELNWWTEYRPETKTFPVRFIACVPVECDREVIK